MKRALRIKAREAARVMLMTQGLYRRPRKRATRADVLDTIRRMGVLQIDTIHVVARSPYLVLWSRLGDYGPGWLDGLLEEREVFEYWAHEASFLPMEAYPWMRHRMIDPESLGWKYSREWIAANRDVLDRVLAEVRENGPVRSVDFERKRPGGKGWWGWKPEKRALELLFTEGRVMVSRRDRFQRVYDLRERVLPGWTDDDLPSAEAADRALARKTIEVLGITRKRWVADYFRMPVKCATRAIEQLQDAQEVTEVEVDGWNEPGLVLTSALPMMELALTGGGPTLTTLLSPFDPLVWDRGRAKEMFGFDYRLECYTPAAKRRYGYFVLPILRRGRLIGRLDPKAHRRDGVMEIKALWLEHGVRFSTSLVGDLARTLVRFARWHGTPIVRIGHSRPASLARGLRAAIKSEVASG